MKDLKHETRAENRSSNRSVVLKIRDYQVSVKVKSFVPQATPPRSVRPLFR